MDIDLWKQTITIILLRNFLLGKLEKDKGPKMVFIAEKHKKVVF